MAIANDTFVEGVDTALESHTPTGPNAGAGWVALGSGAATVRAVTDDAAEANAANGNRFRMTTDLGTSQMDVSGDFTAPSAANIFPGVLFRIKSDFTSWGEFIYEDGQWKISDGTTTVTLTEAWPGGTVLMFAEIRTNIFKGKVNGVTKVTLNSDLLNTNTFAGIILGNFTSGATGQITIDNYYSESFSDVTADQVAPVYQRSGCGRVVVVPSGFVPPQG